ncbi:MAG: hypothetical protein LBB86_03775 [Oscillospiraceae bacterium]|nr:hypothetical protein [Oscillospiraceae bacterium]
MPKTVFETIFDSAYLMFALAASCLLLRSGHNSARWIFGVATLTLFIGDACHLIPRIFAFAHPASAALKRAKGAGRLAASVTMTLYYVMVAYGLARVYSYSFDSAASVWAAGWIVFVIMAVTRLLLLAFPGNHWLSGAPSGRFPLYRNLPFAMMGALLAAAFLAQWNASPNPNPFKPMPLAILLSFAFYLPVALDDGRHPKRGMLMIPKTLTYVWMTVTYLRLTP